jgi:hypothetical protein
MHPGQSAQFTLGFLAGFIRQILFLDLRPVFINLNAG